MKSGFCLLIILSFFEIPLSGQVRTASALLSAAIYEEVVSGNLDKATELYLDILKEYPDDRPMAAKTLYHLGLVNEKLGNKKAVEYYTLLVNGYPEQTKMVALARARLANGSDLSNGKSKDAAAHFKRASDHIDRLEFDPAIREYDTVQALLPGTALALEARYWKGHALYKNGKTDEALTELHGLLEEHPNSPIAPVTGLMVKQLIREKSEAAGLPASRITSDGRYTDPSTGIEFTRVKTIDSRDDDILGQGVYDLSPGSTFLVAGSHVVQLDGSPPVKLFNTPSSWEAQPCRLSPDGSTVAFFDTDTLKLLEINPLTGKSTGTARPLQENGRNLLGRFVNWSPDGKELVFSRLTPNDRDDLWKVSLPGGGLNQLTNTPSYDWYAVYSRDGRYILYRQGEYPTFSIRRMPSGGGNSEAVIESGGIVTVYWTSDQKYILSSAVNRLIITRLEDQQQFPVAVPAEVGTFIPYIQRDSDLYFYRKTQETRYSIKIISPEGGPAMEIAESGAQSTGVINWTPDNQAIINVVYNQNDSSQMIRIIPLTGRNPVALNGTDGRQYKYLSPDCSSFADLVKDQKSLTYQLRKVPISVKDGRVSGNPLILQENLLITISPFLHWSPDGSSIALPIQGDIRICPTTGEKAYYLTRTQETETLGNWSPDGSMITAFVKTGATREARILRVPEGTIALRWTGSFYHAWSPDSKKIALVMEKGLVNILDVATGKMRELVNWREMGIYDLFHLKWSPDGKRIALIGDLVANKDSYQIYLADTAGQVVRELNIGESGFISTLSWSPDGRWIAYSCRSERKTRLDGSLWKASLRDFIRQLDTTRSYPDLAPGDGTFTDPRDGNRYPYKMIGNQTWMTRNLAWLPEVGNSVNLPDKLPHYYIYGYAGTDTAVARKSWNYQLYGVLYNWYAAMNGDKQSGSTNRVQGICPAGWHLPTDEEWLELEKFLGLSPDEFSLSGWRNSGSVGLKLQIPYGSYFASDPWKGGNSSGFNSLPGGYRNSTGGLFFNGMGGYYLSSTEADSVSAYGRAIIYLATGIIRFNTGKGFAYSIRCVKN